MARESIGVIGIGLVGSALCAVLLRSGYDVLGYDVDRAKLDALLGVGGRAASSPADVAQGCRRVILSLPTSAEVEAVVAGIGSMAPGIVIDTTTGHPREVERLAARLAGQGVHFLDATIAGSSRQVAEREAVFLVGGDEGGYRSCADLWGVLSERVLYMGPPGSGAKAKLAVNLVLGLNRAVLAEGLVFAERLGIAMEAALELFACTLAYSRAVDVKGRKMVSGDFAPEARLAQHRKDVGLMLALAGEAGQGLPLTEVHAAVLDRAIAAGDGELDNSAVIREIVRRGGGQGGDGGGRTG